ncbi:putative thioredoxin [Murinocardiopsis flavida]|uniref:Putative thioredoxin n=1 Tax=Murinocardiopsis flavida TaxID=645275 RepID=A0A2P8CMR4_9ACTN|nr:tetratricopeptide repeat protein [Murinocardiopsis flavida]PSK86266.1 putative thioredoxin [Murinocardiopsis flavida]
MQPSDFSMHSAVDLGARKAALERDAKRQAEQSSGTANPYSVDVTEENFQAEVLEGSTRAPVVIALLQARSEQSAQVESALDRLAIAAGGQWLVAKIDVQASPQLAQALQAPGVPMVAMVIGGQVVPGPTGPATEEQLREWLQQVFDALRQQGVLPQDYTGLGAPGEAAEEQQAGEAPDPVQSEAEEAMRRGDIAAAEAAFAKALEADPADESAKLGLAQVRLVDRVRSLDPDAARASADAAPDDVAAQLAAADVDMYGGMFDAAFERLIATVRRTRDDDRDKARTHLLSLFDLLPAGDPRIAKARRGLTSALF